VQIEAVITSVVYVDSCCHTLASGPDLLPCSYTHALRVRVINKPDEDAAPLPPASPNAITPTAETTEPSSRQASSDTATVHSRAASSTTATSTVVGDTPRTKKTDQGAKNDKKAKQEKNRDLIGKLNSMVKAHLRWIGDPQTDTRSQVTADLNNIVEAKGKWRVCPIRYF
jgi:hypothetical protein